MRILNKNDRIERENKHVVSGKFHIRDTRNSRSHNANTFVP